MLILRRIKFNLTIVAKLFLVQNHFIRVDTHGQTFDYTVYMYVEGKEEE